MTTFLRKSLDSTLRDFRRFPSFRDLTISLLVTVAFAGAAWLVMPDFANLDRIPSLAQMVKIAVVAFFFPALFEETVFRGVLNPSQTLLSVCLSTALFVLWHPVAGYFLIREAFPYMVDPRFLLFVTIFGLLFCGLRRFTGSLWTPILCHWILIVIWKGLGGAQFLT